MGVPPDEERAVDALTDARYSQMAWVVARMWASLNAVLRLDPRCPEVPNATIWSGFVASGIRS